MKMLIIILSLIVTACSLSENKSNKVDNALKEPGIEDSLILNWQADSLGCRSFRSGKTIKEIFDKYELKRKSINEMKYFLGKANEEYTTERYYGLRYYAGNSCINGKLPSESDKCWYEVLVDKDKKEESGYAKACQ